MSVLIKGAKLPENCCKCFGMHYYWPSTTYASNDPYCQAVPLCMVVGKEIKNAKTRDEFCPLTYIQDEEEKK